MRTTPSSLATTRPVRSGSWLSLVFALLLAAGCVAAPTPALIPAATPVPSRVPQSTPAPSATATAEGPLTLTWWTPEFLSPKAAQPVGPLLAKQLAEFEAANGGQVRVSVVPKARYGKGGLLDFLLTARPVAPSILPDLVVLDVSELEQAAAVGLLQPLDGLLDESVTADLYPFATSAGRFGDHLLAVQFAANLEHLAYRPDQVKEPPGTWDELLDAGMPYLFPMGSPQPGSSGGASGGLQPAIISQYLSAGAAFDPAVRQLAVEAEPLTRLLTFYETAAKTGVLPPNALELADQDATWAIYSSGKVPMAGVSARHYLADSGGLKSSGFAPAPGQSAPVKPVAGGWALGITTTDPERQRAAADLIAWLMKPENAGSWAIAAGWLPTSPAALKTWGTNPYFEFLDQQLASSVSVPVGPESAQAAVQVQKAVEAVLKGDSTPAEAVEAAVNPPK
jgi:ABC-type glycerol-3-phosphate transport system substrate-binding protein